MTSLDGKGGGLVTKFTSFDSINLNSYYVKVQYSKRGL